MVELWWNLELFIGSVCLCVKPPFGLAANVGNAPVIGRPYYRAVL